MHITCKKSPNSSNRTWFCFGLLFGGFKDRANSTKTQFLCRVLTCPPYCCCIRPNLPGMVCFIQVLGPLLVILLQGSMKLRLAAARLCERLLPQAPLEMVQVLALFT